MPKNPHFSSERSDWETPQSLFDGLNAEFRFEVDVCANSRNAKCKRYFAPADDGLSTSRDGAVCWMNPPYGRVIGKWMQKAFEESQKGAVVCCLVPAKTDTAWWHKYATRGEIRFLRGRLHFSNSKSAAPFPSAIVVFRPPVATGRFQLAV